MERGKTAEKGANADCWHIYQKVRNIRYRSVIINYSMTILL